MKKDRHAFNKDIDTIIRKYLLLDENILIQNAKIEVDLDDAPIITIEVILL